MNIKTVAVIVLMIGLMPSDNALANDPRMQEGVAGYFEGRVRPVIEKLFTEKTLDWFLEAIESATKEKKRGSGNRADVPGYDDELRDAVQAELKKRIEKWLAEEFGTIIRENVLSEIAEKKDIEEAEKICKLIVKEINTSMNKRIDSMISNLYEGVTTRLKKISRDANIPKEIDITDLKGSIGEIFTVGEIGSKFKNELAALIGDASANAVEKRVTDAFGGKLPPEFTRLINSGPKEFDKYVKKAEKYLPGAQLDAALSDLKESFLDRAAIKVPTPVYVSALAFSASSHFSRAYDGVTFNAYEMKRGIEVTRVMVWQAENKDWVNLSVMQLNGLTRDVAARLGMGDAFDGVLARMKEPLQKLKKISDDFDKFLKDPVKDASKGLHKISKEAKLQFENLQNTIMDPVKDEIGRFDSELRNAGSELSGLIPDWANGVPKDWSEIKKRLGIKGGVLGKDGNIKPKDILGDIAEKTGIKDAIDDAGDALREVKDETMDSLAAFAADALEDLDLLGPSAKILDIERTPARNESKSRELDPVLLHNGEFVTSVTDIVIPGREVDLKFTRTYRGRSGFLGEFGWRWTHSFAMRLRPADDGASKGLTYVDEEGGKFFFRCENGNYKEPQGVYAHLEKNEIGGFDMKWRNGNVSSFDEKGRLVKSCDRHKNCNTLFYDRSGLVSSVADVFGRKIEIRRRDDGLITGLKDFSGRAFHYEYNGSKELIGVTSPEVDGFAKGKTTAYRYTDAPDGSSSAHLISIIVDPKGQAYLKNRYDDDGRIIAQSYGGGPWMKVVYAENDPKSSQSDMRVKTRAWVTGAAGHVTLYENDADGRLLRMWKLAGDKYKLIISNHYNGDGEQIASCYPSGRCILYFYGEGRVRGDVLRIEDHPGGGAKPEIVTIEYENEYGRPLLVTNSEGEETRYEYSDASDAPSVNIFNKNSDGEHVLVESLRYNGRGQLVERGSADGSLENYIYFSGSDPDGDGVHVKDATEDGKEGGGYLKCIIKKDADDASHADGTKNSCAASFGYDPVGNIVSEAGEDNVVNRYSVNALNEITKDENGDGVSVSYIFDANDNIARAEWRDKNGSEVFEYDYDPLDRTIEKRVKTPNGKLSKTNYYYNDLGLLARVARPEGGVDEYTYDDEGRPHCEILAANSIERVRMCVERDLDEKPVAIIDPSGVRYGVNEIQDRLGGFLSSLRKQGPRGDNTFNKTNNMRPEYDGEGKLIALTDSANNTTRFAYDDLGRVVVERYADNGEKKFAYDEGGDVTGYIDRGGQSLVIKRDKTGRPVSRRATNVNGEEIGPLQDFEYDKMGRLIKATDHGDPKDQNDDIVTSFEYDELSRPVAEHTNSGWLTRSYDKDGSLASLRLPSGETFYYIYNDDGTVSSVHGNEGPLAAYEYDPAKNPVKTVFKNDFSIRRSYYPDGLACEIMPFKNAGVSVGGFETHYENGRASKETGLGGVERIYRRDDEQRLVEVADTFQYDETKDAKVLREWNYVLDNSGNVLEYRTEDKKNEMKCNEVNECVPAGETGRAQNFKFDENGALVSDGEREFRYDALGRLVSVLQNGKQIAGYRYDAFDRRVAKITEDGSENAVWDGWRLVQGSKNGSQENYAYLPEALTPFAVVKENGVAYLVSDRLMSARASVENGERITARCSYDPFGKEIETLLPTWDDEIFKELLPYDNEDSTSACRKMPGPFRFAGQIYDDETGFIYLRHRYYDPRLGRFITPDPLDYKVPLEKPDKIALFIPLSYHRGQGSATRATFPNRPMRVSSDYRAYPFNRLFSFKVARDSGGEANLYLYARGDPSTFVDPLGLASIVFDRSDGKITLYDRNENDVAEFFAANNVSRKKRDVSPRLINGGGPFPNGTFAIGIPEFYTQNYRDEFYSRFGLGSFVPGESDATGPGWKGERRPNKKDPRYNVSQGIIRFRAGSSSSEIDSIARDRGLFIHGGRDNNYAYATQGCIRARDDELEIMAANFIEFRREGDPVTKLIVQE